MKQSTFSKNKTFHAHWKTWKMRIFFCNSHLPTFLCWLLKLFPALIVMFLATVCLLQHCMRFKWIFFQGLQYEIMLFWDHYTFWVPEQKDVAAAGLHGWHTFPKYFWLDFCMAAACVYHIVLSHINSVFLALYSLPQKCDQFVRFLYSIFVVGRRMEGRGQTGGWKRAKALSILWTIENKWVCYKRTIKVPVSCSWRCPGTAAPSVPHVGV